VHITDVLQFLLYFMILVASNVYFQTQNCDLCQLW